MHEETTRTAALNQELAGKYLTFNLQKESYGIDVLRVREIIRLTAITTVPQMPDYVKGVINLRGKIIPVMDLRLRFGFTDVRDTEQTCIVVAQVRLAQNSNSQMGLIVDGVEEVAQISAAEIEETPDFGGDSSTSYILGMAKIKGSVKALLDVNQIVSSLNFESLVAVT